MKKLLLIPFLLLEVQVLFAQKTDLGIWAGTDEYFGDLNSNESLRFINPAGGLFFRYNFDERISVAAHLGGGRIWASDSYSSDPYLKLRNLSFFSLVENLGVQAEFNFMPFEVQDFKHPFTPFLALGFGIVHFNPEATYQGKDYFLQPLGTEGQGYPEYPNLKRYPRVTANLTINGGFKWQIAQGWGMQLFGGIIKTHSDYLDDAGGLYADPLVLLHESGLPAAYFSDPSVSVNNGEPVGVPGKQRADAGHKDDYAFIGLGVFYSIPLGQCPSANEKQ